MPRLHSLTVRATKVTPSVSVAAGRPYQWRRRGMTRAAALRRAGLGTARIPPAPDGRNRDG